MTTRADLIETAARALEPWDGLSPNARRAQATAVLDAVLPQITTAEQLEALPGGTKLINPEGEGLEVQDYPGLSRNYHGFDGVATGAENAWARWGMFGPLTVVWQPQPEQETRADA